MERSSIPSALTTSIKSPKTPNGIPFAIRERDVIKTILEFLEIRGLHITQLSLEREAGVINGAYSDDLLFLRQLILDGQWDNALDFVEPLKPVKEFDFGAFRYNITKYKFFELLCVKLEPGPLHDNDFAVEELVECLKDLEHICPSPEDYRHLCALLTLPKLSDHEDFKNWNPSSARVECFYKVHQLCGHLLPPTGKEKDRGDESNSSNDRLSGLLAKGRFYEGCVDYCQAQAIGDKRGIEMGPTPSELLNFRPKLGSTDLSLVCWLEMVGKEQFAMPFKQKQLELKVEHIRKPKLEAPWTETIMATPIKPGGHFPHNLVPSSKLKFAEKMSQSMTMSMLPPADLVSSTFPSVPRCNPMSQSTAAGFCLGTALTEADAMAQSLLIDEMMESSQLAKASRPDTLRGIGMVTGGPSHQPIIPTSSAQLTNQMMSMSMAPQVICSVAPMAQSMINYDFTPVRRQLDEMTRRSMPPSRLPTVPELGSPCGNSQENLMTQSRLFQQFSATKQLNELVMPRAGAGMGGATGGVGGGHVLPLQSEERLFQQRVVAAPGFQNGSQQFQNQDMMPSATSNIPMSYSTRPQSIAGLSQLQQQQQQQMTEQLQRPVSAPAGMGVQFVPVCRYDDSQAIRATSFHPSGRFFALGTNSKQLHICLYPDIKKTQSRPSAQQPTKSAEIAVTRPKQHRGSVYCLSFNPNGDLLATGSNDKTIRLMAFNEDSCKIGAEMELTCHDGTVRDLIFIESSINRSTILVSGGAGNCHLNVTDCNTGQLIQSMKGHSAPILGLYTWTQAANQFVSCSQDKTIKFWDLRQQTATNVISPGSNKSHNASPVTSVCVDPNGKLLVSGHEDASVALFDITGNRVLQTFRPHGDEVRTVRFSNAAFYLLTASYDKRVVITDMRGDLMAPLMYLPVAEHSDKVVQCRWHPHDFSFLSTSADRSAVLWSLPNR